MRAAAHLVFVLLLAAAAVGCSQFRPGAAGASAGAAPAGPNSGCEAMGVIDDGEDGDNQVILRGDRAGYLYTFKDAKGTQVKPDGQFAPTSGGANGSRYGLRIHGQLADRDATYAGLGLSFRDPKGPYDASRYQGISFWARVGAGSATAVRLKVPDVQTDPEGHTCKECFNDFGVDFQATETWTHYVVSFADLKQGAGWGDPRPPAIDLSRLYSLQWQVATRGAPFDLWIDDVRFVGCKP